MKATPNHYFLTLKLLPILVLGLVGCGGDDEPTVDRTGAEPIVFLESQIILADSDQASRLLQSSDEYTRQLGVFDLRSKTMNRAAATEADYLAHAAQQTRSWTSEEIITLREIIRSAEARIEELGLVLNFPPEIVLISSTMQEEGGAAGYTRQNFIVLNSAYLSESLFLHELFHVYSRANPEQRDALYATIGFQKTNEIVLPEPLATYKISNPDATVHDHVIELTINDAPQEAIFFIYASRDYTEGTFFDYLTKRLLLVEGPAGSKRVQQKNGQPVLVPYGEAIDLLEQIGTNTNYDIDPEEVMADHFTLLVLDAPVPEPDFLAQAKAVLQ